MKGLVSLLQVLENGNLGYTRQEDDADFLICPLLEREAQLSLCDWDGGLDFNAILELREAGYHVVYGGEGVHCISTAVGYISFEEI